MIKWTEQTILEEAKKYKTRKEFQIKAYSAYRAAHRRKILEQVCKHMAIPKNKPLSFEQIKQEALKYNTRTEFQKANGSYYTIAHKRGWINDICGHMGKSKRAPYTNEELKQIALQYKTKNEFIKGNPSAYAVAMKRSLSEIFDHMPQNVCIGNTPHNKKWTKETVTEKAKEYATRTELREENAGAYHAICKLKLVNEACSHMKLSVNISVSEQQLFDFIKEKYSKTQKLRIRKIKIENKPYIQGFDIDIYVPELRKGIEFDGQYWHSKDGLLRNRSHWPMEDVENYHKIKDEYFLNKGIKILHINEKDWLQNKKECIKKCIFFLENK